MANGKMLDEMSDEEKKSWYGYSANVLLEIWCRDNNVEVVGPLEDAGEKMATVKTGTC